MQKKNRVCKFTNCIECKQIRVTDRLFYYSSISYWENPYNTIRSFLLKIVTYRFLVIAIWWTHRMQLNFGDRWEPIQTTRLSHRLDKIWQQINFIELFEWHLDTHSSTFQDQLFIDRAEIDYLQKKCKAIHANAPPRYIVVHANRNLPRILQVRGCFHVA